MGAVYRVRQFLAALWPVAPELMPSALPLSADEAVLFYRLSPALRRHSLRVAQRVRAQGDSDTVLLRAALLHDVGKTYASIRLHHRVLFVLLARFAPSILRSLTEPESGRGWRLPFRVQAYHSGMGADLLREAGSEPEVIELVARHHDAPNGHDSQRLITLRAADQAE